MAIFDELKKKDAESRLSEEFLYAEVLREIETGFRRDGLWAKALSESEFDEGLAKSLYIKYRVQSLKDELTLIESQKKQEAEQRVREHQSNQTGSQPTHKVVVPLESFRSDNPLTCNNCGYYGKMVWTRKVSFVDWFWIILLGGIPLILVNNFLDDNFFFGGLTPLFAVIAGYVAFFFLFSKYEVKCPKCMNRGIVSK